MPGAIERNTSLFVGALVVSLLITFVVLQGASLTPASGADDAAFAPTPLDDVSMHALARVSTVRVAGRTCDGLTRGSGFVVDGALITNRHLTRGAAEIKVDETVAPRFLPVERRSDEMDISVAAPVDVLPLRWAAEDPEPGDPVWAVGHAGGGPVVVQATLVAETLPEGSFGLGGPVLVLEGMTSGGFSGGPVINRFGDVVGVLQGVDLTTERTLAIPASAVREWIVLGNSAQVTSCPADE